MSSTLDKNKDIHDQLLTLGLNKNEAMVYLSLLTLGEVGASKIVKDTGLHGQTVYSALETLEEKSLVKFVLVKNRKKFSAQSPSILIDLIEKQKTVASSIAKSLENRFSTVDTQSIEIVKGQESLVANEMKLLKESADGATILVFGGLGDSFIKNMSSQFNEYEFRRQKKGVKLKYLGTKEQEAYLRKSKEDRFGFDYHFLPGGFSGVTTISVFPNLAVVMYLFDESVVSITVRNKKIANSYVGFFESLWTV